MWNNFTYPPLASSLRPARRRAALEKVNPAKRLDKHFEIERKCAGKRTAHFIGDANGADKAMQTYLADRRYRQATVFRAGSECRNNIGQWETRYIEMNG